MTRARSILFSVAIAALLLSIAPAFAGAPDAPAAVAAPTAAPAADAGRCTQPAPETAVPAIAAPGSGLFLAAPAPTDFILCSCHYCKTHPDVICQISPSGFSILCSDYYASRCL